MNPKSGIYLPNDSQLRSGHFDLLRAGQFKWAVARFGFAQGQLEEQTEQGLTIIMQAPDHFSDAPFSDPWAYAAWCYQQLMSYEGISTIAVLDNEPNLDVCRSSLWHAEQFCRWYRAVVAHFRYLDPGSHWRLPFPALVAHPLSNWSAWLAINEENIDESDGLAWHSYWQTPDQMFSPDWAWGFEEASKEFGGPDVYITEYSNSAPDTPGVVQGEQYQQFLKQLPDYVQMAAKFILGGTEVWRSFWLTPEIAQAIVEA